MGRTINYIVYCAAIGQGFGGARVGRKSLAYLRFVTPVVLIIWVAGVEACRAPSLATCWAARCIRPPATPAFCKSQLSMLSMTTPATPRIDRRRFGQLAASGLLGRRGRRLFGSRPSADQPQKVWGSLGAGKGQFSKPRAIAIDDKDQLYIVDMTARIQVFDTDGNYIRGWQTPEHTNGRPTGLTFDTYRRPLAGGRHALQPRAHATRRRASC